MKAASSPSTFAVITVLVMSYGHLLTAWAHQEDSVNVASSAQFFDAATTTRRDFLVSEPEERILGKKPPSPPPPTGPTPPGPTGPSPPGPTGPSPPGPTPLTASPSSRPTFKPVPLDACAGFTRAPTTPPTPSPTQACTNPGQCSTMTGCCPGFSCRKVKNVSSCVPNRRHLREGSKVPFETTTEERRLGSCDTIVPDECNVNGNPLQCPPADHPVSIICNYPEKVYVKPCMESTSMSICCEDGGGGYYEPAPCWVTYRQCCAKGYTNTNAGCLARDCCDESEENRIRFCPRVSC